MIWNWTIPMTVFSVDPCLVEGVITYNDRNCKVWLTCMYVCVYKILYNNCDAWYTWIFAWNRMATFWTLDIISLCHNVTMRQELALHWCLRSFLTDRHFFVRGGGEATVAGAPRGATGPLAGCSSASWCVMELEPEYVVSCGFRNWRVNGLTKKIGTTNMILI